MSAVSSLEQPPSPPSTESSYQQSIDVIVAALRRDAQFASASYITLLEEAEKIYERREASKIRLDAERMRAASAALAPTAMQLPSINPGMIQSLPTHSLAGTSSISTFTPHMHLHSFSITCSLSTVIACIVPPTEHACCMHTDTVVSTNTTINMVPTVQPSVEPQ
jgi:hypothetical protein